MKQRTLNTIPNQFSSKFLFNLHIDDLPGFANVHTALTLSLGVTHLSSQNELAGVHGSLIELSLVLVGYFGADARTTVSLGGSGYGAYSIYGGYDLAHVLALVQVSSLEDVSVLQSECLAALDELFDVLHLFESHLLSVDLLDKGLAVQCVEQLAEDLSVLETVLEVVHSHFLVRERLSQDLLDPCSALNFLVKVVLGFKLLLDISTQTGFLGSDGRHCVGMLKLFVI